MSHPQCPRLTENTEIPSLSAHLFILNTLFIYTKHFLNRSQHDNMSLTRTETYYRSRTAAWTLSVWPSLNSQAWLASQHVTVPRFTDVWWVIFSCGRYWLPAGATAGQYSTCVHLYRSEKLISHVSLRKVPQEPYDSVAHSEKLICFFCVTGYVQSNPGFLWLHSEHKTNCHTQIPAHLCIYKCSPQFVSLMLTL